MTGFDFVDDTNFLIDVHEGREKVEPFLDSSVIVSVITEIELLGRHKITQEEQQKLRAILDDCIVFELTAEIRRLAIELRQKTKIKTPDAIIAATSKYLQIPLVSSDKGFKNIEGIELILI
ncbi:type II toxin-antitoxin system VapC family toxin [Mucilaginibacter sp. dw_454]|uniref:type II toxin-antitoxin system VapC family toxin n=1 Tax=Mucilaginibacter sp. dw_454 TaxID=2720079 RepID=UPI001BD4FD48|nr:type II toxin-antitoxin system VapC family toxin [Mucilaginibacter sp. dw_454]